MAEMIWDPRLITPERVMELAGHHPIYLAMHGHIVGHVAAGAVAAGIDPDMVAEESGSMVPTLMCGDCGQPITGNDRFLAWELRRSLLELATDILRHRVAAHGKATNGT